MIVARVISWIERLPAWLQPAAWGAAILASIVTMRALFAVPFMFSQPQLMVGAIAAIGVASAAGACGGFAYSLLGRRLLTLPWVGRYLAGVVCVAAYLLPLLLVLPKMLPSARPTDLGAFNLHDPVARNIWLGCTLFFGIVIGQTWFEAPPPRHHPVHKRGAEPRRSNDR
jgi:hypothetical protein